MRRRRGVSDAHVEAAHAYERLTDLARLDGGPMPGKRLFYRLIRHIRNLPRGERHFVNRHLDRPNARGYIFGRDIHRER